MTRWFVQTIFILLFTVMGLGQLKATPTVYLGIVSPTSGGSFAGHTFLLYAHNSQAWHSSIIYEYNLEIDPSTLETLKINPVKGLLQAEHSPLKVFRLNGGIELQSFSRDERFTYLLPLRLKESQINSLISNLEKDYRARVSGSFRDYNILSKNCATALYDQINAVLEIGQERLSYLPLNKALLPALVVNPISMTIPVFSVAPLLNHPLVDKQNVYIYRQDSVRTFDRLLESGRILNSLMKSCQVSEAAQHIMLNLHSRGDLRMSTKYLNTYSKLLKECSVRNKRTEDYNLYLELLRLGLPPGPLRDDISQRILQ